jgi:hypothetical protein
VIAAYLHALIEEATPTTAFVDDQVEKSLVTGDYAFIKDTPGNRLAKVKTDALLGQVSSGITVGDIQVPDNAIQNADMWYWQRGLNVDRVINGTNLRVFGPDRFNLYTNGTWNIKIRNLDDGNLGSSYPRQNRLARITAVGSHGTLAASENVLFRYVMEGYDFARIDGLPLVYTMWVYTNRTGVMYMSVRLVVANTDATYEQFLQDFLINPNALTQVQLFFPARTTNLAKKSSDAALYLDIALAAATNLQGPPSSSWTPGNTPNATTRQTNFLDVAGNVVDIWGPCLRTGSIAVPHRVSADGSGELRKIQRYCCKTYPSDMNPGTGTYDGAYRAHVWSGLAVTHIHRMFPVEMRVVPTLSFYGQDGTPNVALIPLQGNVTISAPVIAKNSLVRFNISPACTQANQNIVGHFVAEADF